MAAGEAAADSEGEYGKEVLPHVTVVCDVATGEANADGEVKKVEGALQRERRWEMAILA
jgi:hypothetical protein